MLKPVLIISDTHYHNFKQYAQVSAKGVNSRLAGILRATVEAAMALKARGGNKIIHCGDVFHVRGALHPSVLNPVVDMYKRLIDDGFEVHMISGNHDLETDLTVRASSSVTALEGIGVKVYHQPAMILIEDEYWYFIPWVKDLKALKSTISSVGTPKVNLIIHAPMNGVITGIPDHGLEPKDFDDLGFHRVFCGHYHNHRAFDYKGGTAYSVGALTHQNWGDVESRAGYIIVGDTVEQHRTKASRFIKVSFVELNDHPDTFYADNYIKVTDGAFTDPIEIQEIKDNLLLRGAKAVIVEGLSKRPKVTRSMSSSGGGAPTLESILGDYLDRTYPGDTEVKLEALEIMRLVEE